MNEDIVKQIINYLILCKKCNKCVINCNGTYCRECKTYFCQECVKYLQRGGSIDEAISFYCKLCVKY